MHGISLIRRSRRGKNFKSQIDTFIDSEFFETANGLELSDVSVYANVQSDPQLAARVREQLIVQEVKGYDDSVSDDEILSQLETKYSTASDALKAVKVRIAEIRAKDFADKQYKDYLKKFEAPASAPSSGDE